MILSKMKNILITSSLLATLIGCSAAVDDELQKNTFEETISEIESQEALNSSNETKSSNPLKYTSFKLLSKDNIFQKNDSIDPVGRNYTLEMCMDLSVNRSLEDVMFIVTNSSGKRSVKKSNSKGCIRWQEQIDLDYRTKRQKEQFTMRIESKFNENNPLIIQYTIEPFAKDNFVDRTGYGFIQNRNSGEEEFAASSGLIEMDPIKAIPKNFGDIDPRNDNDIVDKVVDFKTCLIKKHSEGKLQNEHVNVEFSRIYTDEELAQLEEMGEKPYKKEAKNIKLINSCLSISFKIDYARYNNTRRIPYTFTVKTTSDKLEGASRSRKLCLYPWTTSGWSFVHDTISGPCPDDKVNERARIFVQEARFNFEGHGQEDVYHINNDLDLSITKTYTIDMFPKIDYGNFIHTISKTEPIFEGNFRLKVLLLAPKKGQIDVTHQGLVNGDYQIISSTNEVVFVEDRRLIKRLNFDIKFNDLPFIHTRTFAIIRLEAMNNDSPYAPLPSTTVGMFHASNKSFSSVQYKQITVDEHTQKRKKNEEISFEDTINNMFAYAETRDNKFATSPIIKEWSMTKNVDAEAMFLKKSKERYGENYTEKSITEFSQLTKYKIDLKGIMGLMRDDYSRETMRGLCHLLFSDKEKGLWLSKQYADINYGKCIKEPEHFMDIKSFDHVLEVKGKPSLVSSKSVSINTSSGKNSYHGTSDRISTARRLSMGGKIGMKVDLPLIFGAGFDLGFDLSKMWGHDEQTGSSNRADSSTSMPIHSDSLTLKFDALTKRCFVLDATIKYKRELDWETNAKRSNSGLTGPTMIDVPYPNQKRIRICEDRPRTRKVQESWYYIGEGHQFHSIIRDRQSLEENPYTILIRGKKNMANFVNFLQMNSGNILLKKIKKSFIASEYLTRSYDEFKKNYHVNNYSVFDAKLPGTILNYDTIKNSSDQYFGEQPVKDFKMFTSPWGKTYERDIDKPWQK